MIYRLTEEEKEWRLFAGGCVEHPDAFTNVTKYDPVIKSVKHESQDAAVLRICEACPVRGYCAREVLVARENGERIVGFWGGYRVTDRMYQEDEQILINYKSSKRIKYAEGAIKLKHETWKKLEEVAEIRSML